MVPMPFVPGFVIDKQMSRMSSSELMRMLLGSNLSAPSQYEGSFRKLQANFSTTYPFLPSWLAALAVAKGSNAPPLPTDSEEPQQGQEHSLHDG